MTISINHLQASGARVGSRCLSTVLIEVLLQKEDTPIPHVVHTVVQLPRDESAVRFALRGHGIPHGFVGNHRKQNQSVHSKAFGKLCVNTHSL